MNGGGKKRLKTQSARPSERLSRSISTDTLDTTYHSEADIDRPN